MAETNPLLLYVYEDEAEGKHVFVARSLTTGHVSMALTREHALECVVLMVHWNMKLAVEERDVSRDEWFRTQRLDRSEFAVQWIEAAKEHGLERLDFPNAPRLALVNAA